jgi:hypothetical protein
VATARPVLAELTIKSSAALQSTRFGGEIAGDIVDRTFVRGEMKYSSTNDVGTRGMLHLRFQQPFGGSLKSELRQVYFDIPVSMLRVRAGRWYEMYTPSVYFGRYLYGVAEIEPVGGLEDTATSPDIIGYGNGSMKTYYTVVEGIRLQLDMPEIAGLSLFGELLPQDEAFEDLYLAARAKFKPGEQLSFGIGGNFNVAGSDDTRLHRYAATAAFSPMEDLSVFTEIAYTDLTADESALWVLAGLTVPAAQILDELRVEVEYTPERLETDDEMDLAWMMMLARKVAGAGVSLNIGADPQKGLRSRSLTDIGAILRVTVKM